jgi:photosystem II stability/assembly factor-like uncharacterized protein
MKSPGWGVWGWTWTTLAILWLLLRAGDVLSTMFLWEEEEYPAFTSLQILVDGRRGWMVGTLGAVMATVDGGHSWVSQFTPTSEFLSSVHFAPDGQHGWAVGSDGVVIATVDGGETWDAQSSPTRASLNSVYCAADGRRAWAVGKSGTVIATVNGGLTWVAQSSPTSRWLTYVYFATDGRHGWAVGDRGVVIATADGGKTWVAQSSPTGVWLSSVYFAADGKRGWAVGGPMGELLPVGADSPVIATIDGGKTWIAQTIPTEAFLSSVYFAADGRHGWAAGNSGGQSIRQALLMKTVDGGSTWAVQTVAQSDFMKLAAFAADGQRGWALGSSTWVMTTMDGGENWTRTSLTYTRVWTHWAWVTTLVALAMLALAAAPRFRRAHREGHSVPAADTALGVEPQHSAGDHASRNGSSSTG